MPRPGADAHSIRGEYIRGILLTVDQKVAILLHSPYRVALRPSIAANRGASAAPNQNGLQGT
jgi:hypothetical protein